MTGGTRKYRDPDWLQKKYWQEELSLQEIGELEDVNADTILRWMKKHGIERRDISGSTPSKEEFITALQRVADSIDKTPSIEDYKRESKDSGRV